MRRLRLFLSTVLFVGLVALSGCGGKKAVTVNGKATLPQGMAFQKEDSVEIRFVPSDAKAKAAVTTLKVDDLSFSTKDVIPGTYKVTVRVTPYAGMPDSQKRTLALEQWNTAWNEVNSKMSVEVGAEPVQNVTVDLAKGTVSKN